MKHLSPKYRIIRYLAKLEEQKDNALYMNNPHVQAVLTNGEPDESKVKALFLERGLITETEFDTTVSELRTDNIISSTKFKAIAKTKSEFNRAEASLETNRGRMKAAGYDFDKPPKTIPANIRSIMNETL